MCPPFANNMVAEKINYDGVGSWIGFLDFIGGHGICSAIGAMIIRGKIQERDGIEGDECEN